MQRIFLGIPTYDNTVHTSCMMGVLNASKTRVMQVACNGSSLLPHGFNILWAMGNGSKSDYFAMCHADIGPDAGWLDTLIDELEATEADVLSAIVPIKSGENVYSTSLCHRGCESHYRLHVNDLAKLPETFGTKELQEVSGEDGELCVNTGLWVCRLGQVWNKQVQFQMHTSIVWDEEGKAYCSIIPEDWDFSQQLHALGLKVMATRKVRVMHSGCTTWQSYPEALNG